MKKFFLLCVLAISADFAISQVREVKGEYRISSVTLYRTQALTVREVEVPDNSSGELAVEISDLPASIVPGSLFASSEKLKIRSVRYFTEKILVDLPEDEIANAEDRIKQINVAKKTLESRRELIESKSDFLSQIELQYVAKLGPSAVALAKDEIQVSGFDFKSISDMTDFVFKQRELLSEKSIEFDEEGRKLDEQLEKEKEKLEALKHASPENVATELNAQASQTIERNMSRKAIVYLAKEEMGQATFQLSYLIWAASWSPVYNMRVTGEAKELNVEYLAHVTQTSGEDWNGVSLSLSTATPNMNAEIPILAPLRVKLLPTENVGQVAGKKYLQHENLSAAAWRHQTSNISDFRQGKPGNIEKSQLKLNIGANALQTIEFSNKKNILRRWYQDLRKMEQQMAVEYIIPGTVTLSSRDDRQMVQILSKSLECSMYYQAVPLLGGYVSRGITVRNTIDQPLLAGEYSAFIDGQYVGRGYVPVTVTGQNLRLGFGIDPQLRCRRELLDKVSSKSWGERTETYKYQIALDNFKSRDVAVRVLDRVPVTKDKGLQITLKEGKDKLSDDPEYRELDLPKGILRWDIKLPASSSGAKSTRFDYSYDLEFDSDMQISAEGREIQERIEQDIMEVNFRR